jgi:hypothetical protein
MRAWRGAWLAICYEGHDIRRVGKKMATARPSPLDLGLRELGAFAERKTWTLGTFREIKHLKKSTF